MASVRFFPNPASAKFSLGTSPVLRHIASTRQGSFTIMEPRFSDARNTPSEPDAGHAAVGSRNPPKFPFPRPRLTRTASFISTTSHLPLLCSPITRHFFLFPTLNYPPSTLNLFENDLHRRNHRRANSRNPRRLPRPTPRLHPRLHRR